MAVTMRIKAYHEILVFSCQLARGTGNQIAGNKITGEEGKQKKPAGIYPDPASTKGKRKKARDCFPCLVSCFLVLVQINP